MKSSTKPASPKSPGRPKSGEAEDRSEAILDAATAVILERGFAGASTREIAKRAGASKETLYQRFPTKASLFAALIGRISDTLLASMADAFHVETDPHQALSDFGERVLLIMMTEEAQRLHHVVIAEARAFPELAVAFWEKGPGRARALLKVYLKELVKQKRMRAGTVEFASEQFLGALLGSVALRSTLAMPALLTSKASIRRWARDTSEAFLRAHLLELEQDDTLRQRRSRAR